MKQIFTTLFAVGTLLIAGEATAQNNNTRRADSPLKELSYTTDINQYGQTVSVIPLSAESQDGFLVNWIP